MGILVKKESQILVQGITGREAGFFVKESLDYGARIVAGVTPGRGGQVVHGVPVFDSIGLAMREHPIDTTVISVPPLAALDAVLEAIENRIPLVVIITERIPRRDVVEFLTRARENQTRIIGPNSLGIINPGETKVGGMGGTVENTQATFTPGPVGVVSRSGGMTTEIANLLTQNRIGQSSCISMGGDPFVGSDFIDFFELFQKDSQTETVLFFCEPGGSREEEFASFYQTLDAPKPVVAFIAGRFVDDVPGTRFGHAAVIVEGEEGSTRNKIKAFEKAGVSVVERLSEIPAAIRRVSLQETKRRT